jgi:hypothetical protein
MRQRAGKRGVRSSEPFATERSQVKAAYQNEKTDEEVQLGRLQFYDIKPIWSR